MRWEILAGKCTDSAQSDSDRIKAVSEECNSKVSEVAVQPGGR